MRSAKVYICAQFDKEQPKVIVKNIILDLGGVIFDVDYQKAIDSFKNLGIKNFDSLYSKKQQTNFIDDFEKGILSPDMFRTELKKHLARNITDDQIDAAWNSLLLSIPPQRITFLKSLKKEYRLFLLSNTNHIHMKSVYAINEQEFGKNVLENIFEKLYMSCLLKMRKPDKEIFELVISENGLLKGETIFIDDSIQHINGAKECGIRAFHLELEKNLLENFLPGILGRKN